MKVSLIVMSGSLLIAGSAAAQEAPPPSAGAQAQPEAQAGAQASATVSDEEVDRFALAALMVEQIAADEAMEQEQKQVTMAAAVQQTGLEPQRFNEIAEATQTDQQLNERIQVAAARHVEAAQQNQ
jgi:hypothetical protein